MILFSDTSWHFPYILVHNFLDHIEVVQNPPYFKKHQANQ